MLQKCNKEKMELEPWTFVGTLATELQRERDGQLSQFPDLFVTYFLIYIQIVLLVVVR